MKRRNKQYLLELYKGTTSLRLFLFLSLGVLTVNTLGVPPLCMLIIGCAGVMLLGVALLRRLGDVWLTAGFVMLSVSFGALWSLRENPKTTDEGVKRIEVISPQKGCGNHLACDAMIDGALVRLNTDSGFPLRVGHVVQADIHIYWPRNHGGRFNYPLYLYRNGYSGAAWLDSADIRQWVGQGGGWSTALWREKCVNRFLKAGLSPANAGIVSAITVGNKAHLDESEADDFRDAGVAHVLVVSGMHVGFLFLLINLLYRRARRKWIVVLAGMVVMWAYAFLVGLTAPVCRATLMFSMMLLCGLFAEQYDSVNALSLSAVLLLVADPLVLYDVGFQLSFLAVFSITMFYPAIPALNRKGVSWLWNVARLSLSAQMLVLPVIIYYFGQMPLYFLLTNIMITLLTPAVFIVGLLTLLPFVGNLTGGLLDMMLDAMRGMVAWVAHLPGSVISMPATPYDGVFLFVSLLAVLIIGNILRSPHSDVISAEP